MKLKLRISPCPNDTFMFHAMLYDRIDNEGLEFEVEYDDIECLNREVTQRKVDISKVSYAILPLIAGRYYALRSGSALGTGNGPLLVSRDGQLPGPDRSRIAVPGKYTTANLLMDKLFPIFTDKIPILFSDIAKKVAAGEFDAGVLIHEGRFTYGDKGLLMVADLGVEWEKVTGLPLPLGAIVVSCDIDPDIRLKVSRVLRRSIEYAMAHPEESRHYIKSHAAEMDDKVIESHISLFVNRYSVDISGLGERAVRELTGLEKEKIFV